MGIISQKYCEDQIKWHLWGFWYTVAAGQRALVARSTGNSLQWDAVMHRVLPAFFRSGSAEGNCLFQGHASFQGQPASKDCWPGGHKGPALHCIWRWLWCTTPAPELPMGSPEVFIGPALQLSVCLCPFLLPSSPVFVSSGCCNSIPQNGWLKQQKFVITQPWRLEVQDEVPGWDGFWWGLSSWLIDRHLLTVSSRGLSSVLYAERERASKRTLVSSSSHKNTSPIKLGSHFYDFI